MDRGRRSENDENANRSFISAERLLMEEAPNSCTLVWGSK